MTLKVLALTILVAFGLGAAGTSSPAQAATTAPKLTKVRCVPRTLASCNAGVRLAVGQKVQLSGQRLKAGQRVTFRWSKGALATRLVKDRTGWTVRVPAGTAVGRIAVTVANGAGRRSNRLVITVIAATPVPRPSVAVAVGGAARGLPAAFDGDGMWVWYVSQSDGGDLDAIAERAAAAGVKTVFVKSADGATIWKQFSPELVAELHQRGLRVCSWQFVYGEDPEGEAAAAAQSVRDGADCFVIDAETQYEGRYASAQRYVAALRAKIGADYPVGLTSFPYVDYHPRLPYSVFLGPGGAQVNLPQTYWDDIGVSVDAVSAKTLANNRIYGAPIAPLGQTYGSPSAADLRRFRAVWAGYGAKGLSWWSWQATSDAQWAVLSEPAPAPVVLPDPGWPLLEKGSTGDQVIWLQQHLASAAPTLSIDGKFTAATVTALQTFQAARGLPVTGETDAATWQAVLTLPVTPADWS